MTWIDLAVLLGIVALVTFGVLFMNSVTKQNNTSTQSAKDLAASKSYVSSSYISAHIPAEGDPCGKEGCDGTLVRATGLLRLFNDNSYDNSGEALWCPKCEEPPEFGY